MSDDRVHDIFSRVAPRYDVANDVLSFGVHRLWKSRLVEVTGVETGDRVLDCATGTGDVAFALADRVGPDGKVVAIDFNAEMLDRARKKADDRGDRLPIRWSQEDIHDLPYDDDHFAAATIAYGIRNVDAPDRALVEMARVVRPGGTVAILEFGQPDGLFGRLYETYSRHLLPLIGGAVTGEGDAYRYLDRSSRAFPAGEAFVRRMEATGVFERTDARKLTGGISWIYLGRVA